MTQNKSFFFNLLLLSIVVTVDVKVTITLLNLLVII